MLPIDICVMQSLLSTALMLRDLDEHQGESAVAEAATGLLILLGGHQPGTVLLSFR